MTEHATQRTSPPPGSEFGGLLRGFRERRNLSQSKLAEKADFDHSAVSRWESGARNPTDDAVNRLADALEVSDNERDQLLAAAGFMPNQISSLFADEPVVGQVLDLLQDDGLAVEWREAIRQILRLLIGQAQMQKMATAVVGG